MAPIAAKPSLIGENLFKFLNVERRCATPADWFPADVSKLWRYNLHYFDDLNAIEASNRSQWHRVLLERWVAENPAPLGEGWEPYPTSRRIVNWIKWAERGNELPAVCLHSLAVQARWLATRLEYHILGNHLFANAKALVYAGLFFSGSEAEQWLRVGTQLVIEQLNEQILSDGGHFERSPMYHAAVLEDVLDLINALHAFQIRAAIADLNEVVPRMLRWLSAMCHPDGNISFFNDAAFNVAPALSELLSYARRLGIARIQYSFEPLTVLAASGYGRAQLGAFFLLCDCAPLGPDYLPAHGHADTLSFELSWRTQRIIVNSGTSLYGSEIERHRQRGTAAHNTVMVDNMDSSEIWAGFRVARRARTHMSTELGPDMARVCVLGTHDGYSRLGGDVIHARRWSLESQSLILRDALAGRFESAEARFHFHPDVDVAFFGDALKISLQGEQLLSMTFEGAAHIELISSTWHPEFGMSIEAKCAVVRFSRSILTTRLNSVVNA